MDAVKLTAYAATAVCGFYGALRQARFLEIDPEIHDHMGPVLAMTLVGHGLRRHRIAIEELPLHLFCYVAAYAAASVLDEVAPVSSYRVMPPIR